MIDVLFVSYNRLAYTRESFAALLRNTDWGLVAGLYVHDDGSTDGTAEHLREAIDRERGRLLADVEVTYTVDAPRGPVAAMNWYLDHAAEAGRERGDFFAKVDNDFVVCPGWLDVLHRVMYLNPGLDILGIEPMLHVRPPVLPRHQSDRSYVACDHIGGKGLIRLRAFERCRPTPRGFNGYFGFTEWQTTHPEVTKGWLDPQLPVFGLDQLPFEPWRGLADEYERQHWARRWSEYADDATSYWSWWLSGDATQCI